MFSVFSNQSRPLETHKTSTSMVIINFNGAVNIGTINLNHRSHPYRRQPAPQPAPEPEPGLEAAIAGPDVVEMEGPPVADVAVPFAVEAAGADVAGEEAAGEDGAEEAIAGGGLPEPAAPIEAHEPVAAPVEGAGPEAAAPVRPAVATMIVDSGIVGAAPVIVRFESVMPDSESEGKVVLRRCLTLLFHLALV